MKIDRATAFAAVVCLAVVAGCSADKAETGDAPAVRQREVDDEGFEVFGLADFEVYNGKPAEANVWTEKDGVLSCTGKPRGYIRTKEEFGDFSLTLEATASGRGPKEVRTGPSICEEEISSLSGESPSGQGERAYA